MPIDPITSFDRHSHIREAARNRVLSATSNELDETDLDKLVDNYLNRQFPAKEGRLLSEGVFTPGDVLLSQEGRDELRDKNFLVEATARTINDLRGQIARSGLAYERQLTSLQRTMQDIGTEVFGEHVATVKYDLSAGNGFQANFGGSNFFDFTYTDLQDPRSKRKFLGSEYLTTELFPAAIMPVAEYEPASIKDIEVDYSLSGIPAFEGYFETTDPMLMIEPEKVFRARYYLPFDVGGVTPFFVLPLLTVVFRFSALASINCMSLSAFTKDFMLPTRFEAMVDGAWQEIDAFALSGNQAFTEVFAFQDTFTDAVRITFTSYGFDSYTVLDRADTENVQLNQLLRESQWKTLFKEESLEFAGRQVDWYIKDVEFAQIRTLERGYAVSSPLPFHGRLRKLMSAVDGLHPSDEELENLRRLGIEVYLDIKAENSEGKTVVQELLPCPSFDFVPAQQIEHQVFIGNVSFLRFFPQINLAETTLQENTVVDHSAILPTVESSTAGVLTIGTDYQVTVDGGTTWLNAWPSSDYYGKVTYAGLAGIRVFNLEEGERVSVSYHPAQRQWLSKTKNFYLRGSRIFTSKSLRQQNLKGTVRAVVILRDTSMSADIKGIDTLFYGVKYVSEQQSET